MSTMPRDPEAAAWVERLQLRPHPEGGWYRETYRSPETWPGGPRSAVTSIAYLLEKGHFSAFHRLGSEELWYHHGGADLLIHSLLPPGEGHPARAQTHRLSARPSSPNGAMGQPQLVMPPRRWFASEPDPEDPLSWVLCGCVVVPGFEFADFEMAQAAPLLQDWPSAEGLIRRLTHS
jgi:predicted cupin superfamily sugar epimerase